MNEYDSNRIIDFTKKLVMKEQIIFEETNCYIFKTLAILGKSNRKNVS